MLSKLWDTSVLDRQKILNRIRVKCGIYDSASLCRLCCVYFCVTYAVNASI